MINTRRNIVTLFVDVSGFTALSEKLDPEIVNEIMDVLLTRFGNAIEEMGGSVDKYLGDAVMAEFGIETVHEDDAERAIRAIFQIKDKILPAFNEEYSKKLTMPLDVSAGVHRGLVVTGMIGNDRTVTGDAVNTAKRLEEAASAGETYISENLYSEVRHMTEGEIIEPLELKGKSEPFPARKLIRERSSSERGTPVEFGQKFIGRKKELKEASKILDSVRNGQCGGVLISGGAGRGKSRLINEILTVLEKQNNQVQIFKTDSYSFEREMSFYPVRRLLGNIIKVENGSSTDIIQAQAEENLPGSAHSFISGLVEILSGKQTEENVLDLAVGLIKHIAKKTPLILVLDDLHWYDENTLEFVTNLPLKLTHNPVFMIAAYRRKPFEAQITRSESLKTFEAEWESHLAPNISKLELGALKKPEALEMIRGYIPNNGLPNKVENKILEFSQGIPFFIVQYLNTYFDEGCFQKDNEEESYGFNYPEKEITVPNRIQDLILSRLDSVGKPAREVCGVGAVLGGTFRPGEIMKILDYKNQQLAELISELQRRGFLKEGEKSGTLEFSHDVILEALENTFLKKKIISWNEAALKFREEEPPEVRLCHAEKAKNAEQALKLTLDAVDNLMRKSLWERVEIIVKKTLQWAGEENDKLSLKLKRRLAKSRAMLKKESLEEIEKIHIENIKESDRQGDVELQILTRGDFFAGVLYHGFSTDRGLNYIEEALELSKRNSCPSVEAKINHYYAEWLKKRNEKQAIEHSELALEKATTAEDFYYFYQAILTLIDIYRAKGDHEKIEECMALGLDYMGKENTNVNPAIKLLDMKVNNDLERGNIEAARNYWKILWARLQNSYKANLRQNCFETGIKLTKETEEFEKFWEIGDKTCLFFFNHGHYEYLLDTVLKFSQALKETGYIQKGFEWLCWAEQILETAGEPRFLKRIEKIKKYYGDGIGAKKNKFFRKKSNYKKVLKKHFGFSSFWPGQKEAIENIHERKHTLAVLPTGGGKSLCYQLPAILFEGTTLVISPLISLMQDQIQSLQKRGIPAVSVSSNLKKEEQEQIRKSIVGGEYKLVYVAPERLRKRSFRETLEDFPVDCLVIDEAHCISQWGHNFRPDYLKIPRVWHELGGPVIFAATATATPIVREDICEQLELSSVKKIITGFNRPNISFWVKKVNTKNEKKKWLKDYFKTKFLGEGSVIIYVGTRRKAEKVAEYCCEQLDIDALAYHAGMDKKKRSENQNEFITGKVKVIVATNAFGMGINKSDVRAVIHYDIPGSIEAYYQEAGRAGRDGKPARAILLYDETDIKLRKKIIEWDTPTRKKLEEFKVAVRELACVDSRDSDTKVYKVNKYKLRKKIESQGLEPRVGMHLLQQSGLIIDRGYQGIDQYFEVMDPGATFDSVIEYSNKHRDYRKRQLEEMIAYAEAGSCRRRNIFDYFNDEQKIKTDVCCDICEMEKTEKKSSRSRESDVLDEVEEKLGKTYRKTFELFDAGHSVVQIAGHRDLTKNTIYSHLTKLVRKNFLSYEEFKNEITEEEMLIIKWAFEKTGSTNKLKPIYEATPEEVGYEKISLALAFRDSWEKITEDVSLPEHVGKAKKKKGSDDKKQISDTLAETLELLKKDYKVEEVAKKRGVTKGTILSHFRKLCEEGYLDKEIKTRFVGNEDLKLIKEAVEKVGSFDRVIPVMKNLPDRIKSTKIKIARSLLEEEDYKTELSAQRVVEMGKSGNVKFAPDLINALQSESANVRRLAALALGKLGDTRAIDALINILEDEHSQVRQYALKAIGEIGSAKKSAKIKELAENDPKKYVRNAARVALSKCSE